MALMFRLWLSRELTYWNTIMKWPPSYKIPRYQLAHPVAISNFNGFHKENCNPYGIQKFQITNPNGVSISLTASYLNSPTEMKTNPCFQHNNVNITTVLSWQYQHDLLRKLIYSTTLNTKNKHESYITIYFQQLQHSR